jgi:16S rRNA A1518/A1519 N6-dimethyltransferase RsmA/KsgA/DIM1 with predicted DNA glycosylase/AP lyase activity
MAHANHVDRRHTQTQERYAADDLETMQAARRYSAHLFNLFREHVGKRVLEVGSGIGTMTRPLAGVADLVVGLEPNVNCVTRLREAMREQTNFVLHACHLEECDRAELIEHPTAGC